MDDVSIDINAPRDKVWALVADFSNMGKWSPELVRNIWLGRAKNPIVGARFLGVNRHRMVPWATLCKVTQCEERSLIEWENVVGKMAWGYRFEDAANGGTRVTEYRRPTGDMPRLIQRVVDSGLIGRDRDALVARGMRTTLERMKAAAEA